MGSGGAEVIKIPIMIFVFLAIMTFIISTLGPVGGDVDRDLPGYAAGNLYYEAVDMPGTAYTYDTAHVSAAASNNWVTDDALYFYRADVTYLVYVHIVRDNVNYNPTSTDPLKKYNDFILVTPDNEHIIATHPEGSNYYVISFAAIESVFNNTDDNMTLHAFPLIDWMESTTRNLHLKIEVMNMTYHDSLYANDFKISLYESEVSVTPGWLDVFAMFFTFDSSWIPTYAFVAYLMSTILWIAIVMTVIRIMW